LVATGLKRGQSERGYLREQLRKCRRFIVRNQYDWRRPDCS
jgi:hypothetical protein